MPKGSYFEALGGIDGVNMPMCEGCDREFPEEQGHIVYSKDGRESGYWFCYTCMKY